MKQLLQTACLLCLPLFVAAQPKIQLSNWASGFNRPVDIAHCGDSRLFVVEQRGLIWVLDSAGNKLDTFLNIDPRVNSSANEQGLLGLAFHPAYAQNGFFFVHYSDNNGGDTQVSRFSVRADNPNRADPNSELSVLNANQPFNNHNGGCIKFGPDGYLYIAIGDGGSGGDPQNNGQKKNTLLGKILRIDVNNSSPSEPYVVPADNPFVGQSDYLPEIWSLGWRNPWRFSFDRQTGDMWIGDVGQVTREEIDFEPAGVGGLNYGWRCYEGELPFNTNGCQPASAYVSPAFTYDNSSLGCSVTGGFIYRGTLYPDLYGVYLFADYCSGRIWGTQRLSDGTFNTVLLANLGDYEFSSFGEDKDGELYIALLSSGRVQRITEICSSFGVQAGNAVSPVCAESLSGILEAVPVNGSGNITYAWSNGQTTSLSVYLNPGTYTVTVTNGNGCSRSASFSVAQLGADKPTLVAADTVLCPNQAAILSVGNIQPGLTLRLFRNNVPFNTYVSTDTILFINAPVSLSSSFEIQVLDTCFLKSEPVYVQIEASVVHSINWINDTLFSDIPCTQCQWLLNGTPIPGANSDFYVPTISGDYQLEVTSPNGCTVESNAISVVISEATLPASVQSFNLSPNPTSGLLQLQFRLDKAERFSLALCDLNGRQIFYQTHQADHFDLPINLSGLSAGTYFLTLQLESGSVVRKVVKQ